MSRAQKKRAGSLEAMRRAPKPGPFASRLLMEWKRLALPREGEGVVVAAVSGGADSVALLLAMDELLKAGRLRLSLTVAHLDHGLRTSSGEDAHWVEQLARSLGYEFVHERARLQEGKAADNLEQAARRARYDFLARTCAGLSAKVLLVAHTMDDQAETVVLRLLRGSGAEGLGGMEPARLLSAESNLWLARPLLDWARRAETEEYCRARGVEYLADEMNEDESFARVKVRKRLLPLMREFNARAVEALSRTATLLREDARTLDSLAGLLLEEARDGERESLSVERLADAPTSLRRRALRMWLAKGRGDLRRLEMVHLVAVERLLRGVRGGRLVELPGGGAVSRRRGRLIFHPKGVENGGERD